MINSSEQRKLPKSNEPFLDLDVSLTLQCLPVVSGLCEQQMVDRFLMYECIFSLLDIEEIERGNSTSKGGFCRDVGMKKYFLCHRVLPDWVSRCNCIQDRQGAVKEEQMRSGLLVLWLG